MRVHASNVRILTPALSIGILALLIAPTVWAAIPIAQKTSRAQAGPSQTGGFGGNFFENDNSTANLALIRYLEANQNNAKFLAATVSSMAASGIILATNKPVMAMGGFSGGDQILTTDQLAALVANGTVRFFLLGAPRNRQQLPPQLLAQIPPQSRNQAQSTFRSFGNGQQSALTTWVTQHCTTVPTKLWQSTSSSSRAGTGFGLGGTNQLYDCATTH
jgi:4-amino-4-deoxy-L-arabinose transferase-like glycosyltransferase